MQYITKNITINVSNIIPEYVSHMGETELTVPNRLIHELLEYSCSFFENFANFEQPELFHDEYLGDSDLLTEHFENLDGDSVLINADTIISVYEYALDNEDKEFTFDVSTENISWVIHDILHAKHDTGGCTIYVENDVERQRIITSLEITKKDYIEELPGFVFLDKLENEFHQRFGEYLDLEEFKYID